MNNDPITIKAGTRSSKLATIQAHAALARIETLLPSVKFSIEELSSPGDRDLSTDLRESPQNFFTHDLDEAILNGKLDCAVHSAKDLPHPMPEGIDWFWLPWREDPRDAIIMPKGKSLTDLPRKPAVGISSERREQWCRERFPEAELKNIRGNIESRLKQLDNGDYDMLIIAAAALNRLGMDDRIAELISTEELPPPCGQGYLAITFKTGNNLMTRLRSLFVKSVDFVGAGIGSVDMCTVAGVNIIKHCNVCIHDALMPQGLLDHLPENALQIDAGKRCGDHNLNQNVINELIAEYARRGNKVARLKGGDPGIFGRLAEEIETLDSLMLPYNVTPGISSMQMATTGTGMLMTRRGSSKGFCVMTPRQQGGGISSIRADERAALPIAFFMGAKAIPEITRQLIDEGRSPETPAALVYSAGTDDEKIIKSTIAGMQSQIVNRKPEESSLPGLFLIGDTTAYSYAYNGALGGSKILLTCSEALQEKASRMTYELGGVPVQRPLIGLSPLKSAAHTVSQIKNYDWMIVTSPSAARCFFDIAGESNIDLRSIPKVLVCGTGTADEFKSRGITPDAMPDSGFSAASVIETIKPLLDSNSKILRLRSDKAGSSLAEKLTGLGADVTDCVLYENRPITYPSLPDFDAVFFASASAVESFIELWGAGSLSGKTILSIGIPTTKELEANGYDVGIIGKEATVESALLTLAAHYVNNNLKANN